MIDRQETTALLALAVDAAERAGSITLETFGGEVAVERKTDDSPVTVADRAAEAYLRERLGSACPDDAIIGEEFGEQAGTSGRSWTIDPIDGTRSFIRGVPLFGVLIGLLEAGRAVLGVIHLPALGETVAGAATVGTTWTPPGEAPRPAAVSTVDSLAEATVVTTDLAAFAGLGLDGAARRIADSGATIRTWGDCYGHALVATGRAEAMLDPRMAIWDSAPLQPIVEGAGGRFTTWDGEASPDGGSAVSTNLLLHTSIMDAIA